MKDANVYKNPQENIIDNNDEHIPRLHKGVKQLKHQQQRMITKKRLRKYNKQQRLKACTIRRFVFAPNDFNKEKCGLLVI